MNKNAIKKILIGLVVAVILLGIYAAVTGSQEAQQSTGSSSSLSSLLAGGSLGQVQEADTDLANAEILRILGSIKNISLDDDIFKNPVFRELEDSRFTIPKPVVIGRPNPFLPIGINVVTQPITAETSPTNSFEDIDTNSGIQEGEDISDFFS